jgi:cytochrome c oxidase assembly protein subunit 15
LVALSAGLIVGVVGEAVLGGIVVYSHLNPYVVMTHFMVGIALLADAVVLALRAGRPLGRATPRVPPAVLWLSRAAIVVLVVAIAAGTATTGTGPHAGGPGAKRLPLPLADMTRVHSAIVIVLVALVLVLLYGVYRSDAPPSVLDRGQLLLAALIVQGLIGYTQYFSHLPAWLVGVHIAGAATVFCAMLWFHDGLKRQPAAAGKPLPAPSGDEVGHALQPRVGAGR